MGCIQPGKRFRLLSIVCKQAVSPEMAIKLAAAFKNTSPEFWLQVQSNYDLAFAKRNVNVKGIRIFWKRLHNKTSRQHQ